MTIIFFKMTITPIKMIPTICASMTPASIIHTAQKPLGISDLFSRDSPIFAFGLN